MKKWLLFLCSLQLFANPLQDAIDRAKPFSTIELDEGVYEGNIIINKPLNIVGKNGKKVIIQNNATGTIITVKSSNVTLKNLIIRSSGHRKEELDSGIKGENINNLRVENCKIIDVLYGINISMIKNCAIVSNTISSKDEKRPLRGDGIKMWYAKNATIKNNTFIKTRDIHLDRCNNVTLQSNTFLYNRFATHLEYSTNIYIQNNIYRYNDVGIITESSKNVKIVKNRILSSQGAARIALVLKGGEGIVVENNIVKYNEKGFYVDSKPSKYKKIKRIISNNEISFNLEALHFHAIIANNVITFNKIHDNLMDVVKDITGYKNLNNKVQYNYWGQYMGFDRNHDNIGDTPYVIKRYFDKLYAYDNKIRFFYGSVVMALVDFLCEIAPFSEPEILLVDKKPIFK